MRVLILKSKYCRWKSTLNLKEQLLCKWPSSARFHWRAAWRCSLAGVTSRRRSFMKKVRFSWAGRGASCVYQRGCLSLWLLELSKQRSQESHCAVWRGGRLKTFRVFFFIWAQIEVGKYFFFLFCNWVIALIVWSPCRGQLQFHELWGAFTSKNPHGFRGRLWLDEIRREEGDDAESGTRIRRAVQSAPKARLRLLHPWHHSVQLGALLSKHQPARAEKHPRGRPLLDAQQRRIPSSDVPPSFWSDPRGRNGGPHWRDAAGAPHCAPHPPPSALPGWLRGLRSPERACPPLRGPPRSPRHAGRPEQPLPGHISQGWNRVRVPAVAGGPAGRGCAPPSPAAAPAIHQRDALLRRPAGVHVRQRAESAAEGPEQGRGDASEAEAADLEKQRLRTVLPLQAGAAETHPGARKDQPGVTGRAAETRTQQAGPREGRIQTQMWETVRGELLPRNRLHQWQPVFSWVFNMSCLLFSTKIHSCWFHPLLKIIQRKDSNDS